VKAISIIAIIRPFYLICLYIYSVFRKLIAPKNTIGFLLDTTVGRYIVGIEDMGVGKKLSRDSIYGKSELDQIMNLVSSESSVLFVGGHVGTLAIPTSRYVEQVTVIEANPQTFQFLQANIELNQARNVTALQLAANDTNGEISFLANRTNSGISKRMPAERLFRYFYDRPTIMNVGCDRLDDILQDKKFNLIFMDIEGSEYFALKGMPNLLRLADNLIVEFMPHHLKEVGGIGIGELLSVISPYFSSCYIPTKNQVMYQDEMVDGLHEMFIKGHCDDGIVFSK